MTNLTNNKAVLSWIDEMTAITKPDKIVWITGEEEQLDALREQAVKEGILIKLNPDKLPGCYLHRTDPDDVARVEDRTFICCEKEEDAGPTNHWVEPKEMYERMYALADGAYKGRTMYIIPYSMSIIGSPFAKYGFELTDSIYVVLNMHIMTRIGKAVCDALGAAIGTKIALLINEDILKIMMLVALPCAAILLMLKKDFGKENDAPAREYTPQQELTRAALIGLGLGCYDGLIGPGTGTFMIMAFTMALSMDLLTASGCAKIANLCSNVASAVLFIFSGKVWWLLALPAAACNMLGAYCGARYAMKGGSKRVRGMIFVVLGLLFIKMGYELLF